MYWLGFDLDPNCPKLAISNGRIRQAAFLPSRHKFLYNDIYINPDIIISSLSVLWYDKFLSKSSSIYKIF